LKASEHFFKKRLFLVTCQVWDEDIDVTPAEIDKRTGNSFFEKDKIKITKEFQMIHIFHIHSLFQDKDIRKVSFIAILLVLIYI
jgi:hypothetical protein